MGSGAVVIPVVVLDILTVLQWIRRVVFGLLFAGGIALGVAYCGSGCGASAAEYELHTRDCAERAAVIVEREGTTLEQDRADLAALRAECEAVQ